MPGQTTCGYALLLVCVVLHEAVAFTFPAPLAPGGFAGRVAIHHAASSLAAARPLRRAATLSLQMVSASTFAVPSWCALPLFGILKNASPPSLAILKLQALQF